MSSNVGRALMLAGVGTALFGISAIVMVQVLPGPHTPKDYFLIGCMSTLVSLVAVFLIVMMTWVKMPNPFFKRRSKQSATKMFDI
jgi:Na+/melibiose symporter-like transporter